MPLTTGQLLLFLASFLATGLKHSSPLSTLTSDCGLSSQTQESLYAKICCDEANVGETVKIRKGNVAQYVLCPKTVPKSCKNKACDDDCMSDCKEWYNNGYTTNGVYLVSPDGDTSFKVYCDMETEGGGWTVFQKRMDGTVNFYLGWSEYEEGFGDLKGEFWLGLEKVHRLTGDNTDNTLRVDLGDFANETSYAKYSTFGIGDATSEYTLTVGNYSGTSGDALTYHNNEKFTTKDNNNDIDINNCASYWLGAWWFKACYHSHLNGLYLGQRQLEWFGIIWYHWRGSAYSLKSTEMKFRRNG